MLGAAIEVEVERDAAEGTGGSELRWRGTPGRVSTRVNSVRPAAWLTSVEGAVGAAEDAEVDG